MISSKGSSISILVTLNPASAVFNGSTDGPMTNYLRLLTLKPVIVS
jgi:hypothetical protein